MKKLLIATSFALAAAFAQANMTWSWWMNQPTATTDISLGLVNRCANVSTFELSAIYSGSKMSGGMQWSFFGINDSDADCALQLSWLFNRGDDIGLQLGMINCTKSAVVDLGFVNFADTCKVQLGLLNFNKNGFLPLFPFINLDKSLFN